MNEKMLPAFRKPPVVETVLGVQFDSIPGFTNAHLGAFWVWLRAQEELTPGFRWTKVIDAPPIEPAFERFEENQQWLDQVMVRVSSGFSPRLQIRDDTGQWMVQTQNTRFHLNWIGQPQKEYSRYQTIRPKFDQAYEVFRSFLRAQQFREPTENQWEVTYVNNIPKSSVWENPEDWVKLLNGLPGPWQGARDARLESIGGSWHFEIPPQQGRLHIDIKHVRIGDQEPTEVLRMTLTARGPIGDPAKGGLSLSEGLDLGRRVIVLMFAKITSTEAHKTWERIS